MIEIGKFVFYCGKVYLVTYKKGREALLQDIYTKDNGWVYMSLLIPFSVQIGDKVKITTTQGSEVCEIIEISYDSRKNLKIHSSDFEVLTDHTSLYYSDFIELAESYNTTTF